MNTVITHPDGNPYTPQELQELTEREKAYRAYREAQNYTLYTEQKNHERTADALERIADALEELAANSTRLADFMLTYQKGE